MSVLARFLSRLTTDNLKREFLDIYLTTSFGVGNFRNTETMIRSFFQNVQNLMQIWKMQKKIQKKSFVFEINASELFAFNCLY